MNNQSLLAVAVAIASLSGLASIAALVIAWLNYLQFQELRQRLAPLRDTTPMILRDIVSSLAAALANRESIHTQRQQRKTE